MANLGPAVLVTVHLRLSAYTPPPCPRASAAEFDAERPEIAGDHVAGHAELRGELQSGESLLGVAPQKLRRVRARLPGAPTAQPTETLELILRTHAWSIAVRTFRLRRR